MGRKDGSKDGSTGRSARSCRIGCLGLHAFGGRTRLTYVDRKDGILNAGRVNGMHVSWHPANNAECAVLQHRNLYVVDQSFQITAQRHTRDWLESSRDLGDVGWPSWSSDGEQVRACRDSAARDP